MLASSSGESLPPRSASGKGHLGQETRQGLGFRVSGLGFRVSGLKVGPWDISYFPSLGLGGFIFMKIFQSVLRAILVGTWRFMSYNWGYTSEKYSYKRLYTLIPGTYTPTYNYS